MRCARIRARAGGPGRPRGARRYRGVNRGSETQMSEDFWMKSPGLETLTRRAPQGPSASKSKEAGKALGEGSRAELRPSEDPGNEGLLRHHPYGRAPKRQTRVTGGVVPGSLSSGPSPGACPTPLRPPGARHLGRSPGHLEPAGHTASPPAARTPASLPPPPSRPRGSHLCVKSPGAGGKLPATCHKEALFSGEVVLWPAVRQRLSPAQRAPSRPHSAPRSLCSSAQRLAAAPPSSAPRLLSSAGLG